MRDIITKLEEMNVEKPQLNEGLGDMAHEAEMDHEVQMARSDLYKTAKYAVAIHKMMKDVSEMEGVDGWVAAKITKAADYLSAVKHHMEGEMMADVELAVVPVAGDMTDAMTMPQESLEEGRLGFKDIAKFGSAIASKIDMEARRRGSADMEPGDADELRYRIAKEMGLVEGVEVVEAEERTYIVVHAKHGKEEIKASSSYGAAKKYAEMKKLKSTAGVDAHLADEEKTATESIEEVEEDVIGDIIAKLPKQSKAPGYTKSDSERMSRLVKQVDRVSQPSSPAPKGPKVSAVTKQKQANAAAKMQTQSKFSEWSKK